MIDTPAPLYGLPDRSNASPAVSVVVPMHNEEGNAVVLVREIAKALDGHDFEIITVDDASTDATQGNLAAARTEIPQLRVLAHAHNAGQSRAVRTGILAARAPIIATLDGDGQNPPGEIPAMIAQLTRDGAPALLSMVAGERQKRQDSQAKLLASRWANGIRKSLLKDDANDTGCGLKVFYRDAFLRLPYFDHIHRYLPALMTREGYEVEFAPVSHRSREHGQSKYTNFGRAAVAIRDLIGVTWLIARSRKPVAIKEL
ncbi:glycosyltransferase family 2 protein [Parvularcula sp. LCG005]|uniref:glycosyltransferase family 2 protein n=1 Tax=Parvularcula sp. LCG005 TaxID=3078805 RepID=UPI00294202F9|nr:glycosyltransferase family 2 protein [Parvularcula sp. LCG005]WOI52727.1 glycosyltransferase family 2 protein [Parvularcula sp. LCG005]